MTPEHKAFVSRFGVALVYAVLSIGMYRVGQSWISGICAGMVLVNGVLWCYDAVAQQRDDLLEWAKATNRRVEDDAELDI